MSQIQVSNLTFSYDGSSDPVFENVSFNIDTDWKLGLIGRNGKGKTTLLKLLMGNYEYLGSITGESSFDYFPCTVSEKDLNKTADDLITMWKPQVEAWQVMRELNLIKTDAEILYRPFGTLSNGERTRVMLAVLFAGENEFLLIDEPTNHLDAAARAIVKDYLSKKKGFILVSHDRDLLDAVCDHVLVLNRSTIEVQNGNFSSWQENKERSDAFAISENEKHLKEIGKLKETADRSKKWADKNENTKIGYDPVKEHDRSISARAYIGSKTKKMQFRVSNFEKRIDREIEEKEGLLQDIETVSDLKLCPLKYHKEVLINARDLSIGYRDADKSLFEGVRFQVRNGERLVISGRNGCGKSSIISAIRRLSAGKVPDNMVISGTLEVGAGLVISYIDQDASFLSGTLRSYSEKNGLDERLLFTVLRKLDIGREEFNKDMKDFSEGQKKKVLIAASLITPAHLYIWDEPLNYIDVFSRMQIEKLIMEFQPTMILVEHDLRFREKVDADVVEIPER